MTAVSQSTRRKLSLLQLAAELDNVSKACRIMGYHRDTFYEIRRAFQVSGMTGLIEERRGPRGPHRFRSSRSSTTRTRSGPPTVSRVARLPSAERTWPQKVYFRISSGQFSTSVIGAASLSRESTLTTKRWPSGAASKDRRPP